MASDTLAVDVWLSSRTRRESGPKAVELLVDEILGVWTGPVPVDPSVHIRKLGCRFSAERIPAGHLEVNPWERVVRIPEDWSQNEQRFSAAHELGHLLFMDEDGKGYGSAYPDEERTSPVARVRRLARTRLETLCDIAARVILVPAAHLRAAIQESGTPTLEGILRLAKFFDVPPPAVFGRLVDLGLLPRVPLRFLLSYAPNRFKGHDSKWRVAARALPPKSAYAAFPRENAGIDRIGVAIPSPTQIDGAKWPRSFQIAVAERTWNMSIESTREDPTWLLLAAAPKCRTLFD